MHSALPGFDASDDAELRCHGCQVGADMRAWFATMPRPQRLLPQKRPAAALGLGGRSSAGTIDAYYLSRHCAVRVRNRRTVYVWMQLS